MITLNGEVVELQEDNTWRCKNLVGKQILDLQTREVLDKVPEGSYLGNSEDMILEAIKQGVATYGFDLQYKVTADQALKNKMIETEKGNKRIFESDEGFITYMQTTDIYR